MQVTNHNAKTTLLLNFAWQPITTITAKAAFLHLLRGSVSCLDKNSQIFHSIDSWNAYAQFYDDQPVIRSCKQIWPIPTVVVVTNKFFRRPKKKRLSVRDMAHLFKNKCQYCLNTFDVKDLTVDHILPKSKGGSDEHDNRTLACKKCNSKKSSIYPYLNVENETVKAPHIPDFLLDSKKIRKEWEIFLQ